MKRFFSALMSAVVSLALLPTVAFAGPAADEVAVAREEAAEQARKAALEEMELLADWVPGVDYVDGKVLVAIDVTGEPQPPATAEAAEAYEWGNPVLDESGFEIKGSAPFFSDNIRATLTLPEGLSVPDAVSQLLVDERIIEALCDRLWPVPDEGIAETEAFVTGELSEEEVAYLTGMTSDPSMDAYSTVWHLLNTCFIGAWDVCETDHSVSVAVIDSGFELTHPDLRDNFNLVEAYDAVENGQLVDSSLRATDFGLVRHGTHVSGIVSAVSDNGIGVAGSSFNADIVPIAAGTYPAVNDTVSFSRDALERSVQYVISCIEEGRVGNLRVVNMSLGGGGSISPDFDFFVSELIDDYDVTVVAASGNTYTDTLQYPAANAGVIGVSAVDNTGCIAPYATTGSHVDVAAPGDYVYSTYANGSYVWMSGTSMAAPMVSGLAALMYAAAPYATRATVEARLLANADDAGVPGRDDQYGAGIIDAYAAVEDISNLNFGDIDAMDYYVTGGSLQSCVRNRIFGLSGDGLFRPNVVMTRGELVTVMWRIAGGGGEEGYDHTASVNSTPFVDVPDGQFYTDAMNWAYQEGVVSGTVTAAGREGRPTSVLTREEAAAIVYNAAGAMGVDTSVPPGWQSAATDWSLVHPWFAEPMLWTTYRNILGRSEVSGGGYQAQPYGYLTRAMATRVVSGFYDIYVNEVNGG